jgi:MoaA/NifB/PqqE/SkfB family radical SAM enzyme
MKCVGAGAFHMAKNPKLFNLLSEKNSRRYIIIPISSNTCVLNIFHRKLDENYFDFVDVGVFFYPNIIFL